MSADVTNLLKESFDKYCEETGFVKTKTFLKNSDLMYFIFYKICEDEKITGKKWFKDVSINYDN